MNRRNFIKRGAIWCPAIVGLKAYPQALTLADPARVPTKASSLTCQFLVQSTGDNDYYSTSTDIAQKIKSSGVTVCQIDLKLSWLSGTDGNVKIQLWSNANKSGTQYGSDSSIVDVTLAGYYPTPAWASFTFATNPEPTGDFWICLVKTGTNDVGWRIDYNHVPGAGYYPYIDATADEAYCAYAFGANRTTTDCTFKLYTMQ